MNQEIPYILFIFIYLINLSGTSSIEYPKYKIYVGKYVPMVECEEGSRNYSQFEGASARYLRDLIPYLGWEEGKFVVQCINWDLMLPTVLLEPNSMGFRN